MGDHIENDDRFKHIAKDPRFRRMRKNEQKVKLDKRFKNLFSDKRFSDDVEIDKRGRPIEEGSKKSDLRRYYRISESEEDDDEAENNAGPRPAPEAIKKMAEQPDFSRGEGLESSSSSEDEDDGDDDDEDDGLDLSQAWGALDADAETSEETSRRLAMCNMDWDRIKAVDILVLCSSFAPKGSVVKSVTVYPSEYGKERMREEDFSGPRELARDSARDNADEPDDDDDAQQRKLRQYQLNRLKYFYALIECDTLATAEKIYADLDGHDYESSGSRVDLRFVPDDMIFDEAPRDACDALPGADSTYEPETFVTKALHQSKVECTWDETDRERTRITRRKFDKDELETLDLKDYLASSSSEEEEEVDVGEDKNGDVSDSKQARIAAYRQLLEGIKKKEDETQSKKLKAGELQITFEPGLKEKTEQLVKDKLADKVKTPFEEMMEKKKKKKKSKKEVNAVDDEDGDDLPANVDLNDPFFADELKNIEADKTETKSKKKKIKNKNKKKNAADENGEDDDADELRLLVSDEDDDDNKRHFDMKKILKNEEENGGKKKKKKAEKSTADFDVFQIDLNDERFAAINSDPNFNIDQSNPSFKKTKSSLALLNNKVKKRPNRDVDGSDGTKSKKIRQTQ